MPNPFVRIGATNVGHQPQERFQPIPESYVGDNNPYRGIENHGVDPTCDPREIEEYQDSQIKVHYEDEPEIPDPIPVRIVTEKSIELHRWRVVRTMTKENEAVQLLGRMRTRTIMQIKNLDATKTLYLAPEINLATSTFGWPVAPGEKFDLDNVPDDEVYGISSDGTVIQVGILYMYSTE